MWCHQVMRLPVAGWLWLCLTGYALSLPLSRSLSLSLSLSVSLPLSLSLSLSLSLCVQQATQPAKLPHNHTVIQPSTQPHCHTPGQSLSKAGRQSMPNNGWLPCLCLAILLPSCLQVAHLSICLSVLFYILASSAILRLIQQKTSTTHTPFGFSFHVFFICCVDNVPT